MVKYRGFQHIWWLTFLTVAIIFGASFLIAKLPENFLGEGFGTFFGEGLLVIPCILGIIMLSKKYIGENDNISEALGFNGFRKDIIPLIIFMPMAAQYFATYMTIHFSLITQILFGERDTSAMIPETPIGLVYTIASLCILAPVLEEVLCRGVMMKMLEKYGVATEILISGLAFAMLHFSIQGFSALFFVGILLGAVKKLTGSIYPSMIMHAVNNLTAFGLMFLNEYDMLTMALLLLFVLFLFVMFPFMFYFFVKKYDGAERKEKIIFRGEYKTGVSVAMILCITAFVAYHGILLADRIKSGEIMRPFEEYSEEFDGFDSYFEDYDSYFDGI